MIHWSSDINEVVGVILGVLINLLAKMTHLFGTKVKFTLFYYWIASLHERTYISKSKFIHFTAILRKSSLKEYSYIDFIF